MDAGCFLSERFEVSSQREEADFLVALTRFNCHLGAAAYGEKIHSVECAGVPLCFIYKRTPKDLADLSADSSL